MWLVESRYPGRKIIVWSATMHAQRNPSKIDTQNPSLDYSGVEPAGHVLAKGLKVKPYVIAFLCAEGRGGLPWQSPGPNLPAPIAGSFEALCLEAGLDSHMIDLRQLPERHALRKPMIAGPLGHSPMRANWPEVVDAFAFIRERTPSTPLDSSAEEEASDPFDLTQEVRKEIANAVTQERNGNVWAPKWNSHATWERWRRAVRPDDQAIAAEEQRLTVLLEETEDPAMRWRIQDVLAAMAAARGQTKLAAQRWAAALDVHPPVEMSQPLKHSGYQHLLNRAAHHALQSQDLKAARALLKARIAKDPRARTPYLGAWSAWVSSKQYDQIVDTMRSSLEARIKNFPDQADEIRKQLAGMR